MTSPCAMRAPGSPPRRRRTPTSRSPSCTSREGTPIPPPWCCARRSRDARRTTRTPPSSSCTPSRRAIRSWHCGRCVQALRAPDVHGLELQGSNNLIEYLFGAGAAAAMTGSLADVDSLASLAARTVDAPVGLGLREDPRARLWPLGVRLAAGLPTRSVAPALAASLAALRAAAKGARRLPARAGRRFAVRLVSRHARRAIARAAAQLADRAGPAERDRRPRGARRPRHRRGARGDEAVPVGGLGARGERAGVAAALDRARSRVRGRRRPAGRGGGVLGSGAEADLAPRSGRSLVAILRAIIAVARRAVRAVGGASGGDRLVPPFRLALGGGRSRAAAAAGQRPRLAPTPRRRVVIARGSRGSR